MPETKCLITGVYLIEHPHSDECYAADLFRQGTTWIINANRSSARQRNFDMSECIVATICGTYFERRGVYVVPEDNLELNDVAREYIKAHL